jgi:hypothetical protein
MGIQSRRNPNVQLAQGPARVRDAVGRVLEIGDEILVLTDKAVMRVASISPMMDPQAPAGAMMVTMVCRIVLVAPRDQQVDNVYFLRHQSEIGDKAIPEAEEGQQGEGQQGVVTGENRDEALD